MDNETRDTLRLCLRGVAETIMDIYQSIWIEDVVMRERLENLVVEINDKYVELTLKTGSNTAKEDTEHEKK